MSQHQIPNAAAEGDAPMLTPEQGAQLDAGFGNLIEDLIASQPRECVVASQGKLDLLPPIPDCIEHGYASLNPRPERSPQTDEAICLRFFGVCAVRIRNWIGTADRMDRIRAEYLAQRVHEEYCDPRKNDVTAHFRTPALLCAIQEFAQLPLGNQSIQEHLFMQVSERLERATPEEISQLVNAISAMPMSERLALVHTLPMLTRYLARLDGIAMDRVELGTQASVMALQHLLTALERQSSSELLRIVTRAAERKTLLAMLPTYQCDGVSTPIQETGSRKMLQMHERLAGCLRPSEPLQPGERLVQISSDAVGILTPTGTLRAIGMCDLATLPAPAPFHAHQLDAVRRGLRGDSLNSKTFDSLEDGMLIPLGRDAAVRDFWNGVLDSADDSSRRCLVNLREARLLSREAAAHARSEALERLTRRMGNMRTYVDQIQAMLPRLRVDPLIGQYEVYLDRFEHYRTVEVLDEDGVLIQQGLPHQAIEAIDGLLQIARIPEDTSAALRRYFAYQVPDGNASPLLALLVTICNDALRTDRFQTTAPHVQEPSAEQLPRVRGAVPDSLMVLGSAISNTPTGTRLEEALDELEERHLSRLPIVHFVDTETFLATTEFYPFSGDQKAEDIAAFVQLQSPEARNEIERCLGVEPSELSLQSLFHFDRYVREQPKETIDRVAATIGKYPPGSEVRTNLLTCFLACARNTEYGDWLLEIAEAEGGDEFFALYAQMVRDTDQLLPRLEALTTGTGTAERYPRENLYARLLMRPNWLLEQIHGVLAAQESQPRSIRDALPNLRQQFQHENEQVRFLRTVFQTIGDSPRESVAILGGMDVLMEHLHDISLTHIPATALPTHTRLFEQMIAAIHERCSPRIAERFRTEFVTQEHATMHLLQSGGELLSFFSTAPMANGAVEFDWLTTLPDSPIRGLAQPLLAAQLMAAGRTSPLYADANPFVEDSFDTCMEGGRMVCFGKTIEEELIGRYLRLRSITPEEHYIGHELHDDEIQQLTQQCQEPGIVETAVRGILVKLVRVDYAEHRKQSDLIDEASDDGLLFKDAEQLFGDNAWVATRVWRNTLHPPPQGKSAIYLFERSQLSPDTYRRWLRAIESSHAVTLSSAIAGVKQPPATLAQTHPVAAL